MARTTYRRYLVIDDEPKRFEHFVGDADFTDSKGIASFFLDKSYYECVYLDNDLGNGNEVFNWLSDNDFLEKLSTGTAKIIIHSMNPIQADKIFQHLKSLEIFDDILIYKCAYNLLPK